MRTGYTAEWRGLDMPPRVEHFTLIFGEGPAITSITFDAHGLSTGGHFWKGQLALASQPLKSPTRHTRRFVRRAQAQGATMEGDRLLVWLNDDPAEWPPEPRERHKVSPERPQSRAWNASGHMYTGQHVVPRY
jgi:hypothetical protein